MEDAKIIELFFARSEQAIKETDAKYGKLCFSVANKILQSTEDSKECVNDTYMCAWNEIPPARPGHFSAYLCKIARLLSLKRLEFSSAKKRSDSLTVSFDELDNILSDESIIQRISAMELGSLISDFLRRERPVCRNVFIRKYVFFDTVEEIALRFGMKENTVKTMLSRTRGRLWDYLRKEDIGV